MAIEITGRGADILAETLISAGVRHIFGVPGDTGIVFYDALYSRTDRITHILARDERHAGFMADGYARWTNTVGVCEVSSGGGVDFLVSGLGEAFAASVPILAITSDVHRRSRGSGAITEIDQEKLFSAVSKLVLTVDHAHHIPDMIRVLIEAATTGRPAPVVAVFPENVFDEQATATIPEISVAVPRGRTAASGRAIAKAAELLAHARRPAIVTGSGVHLASAWAELREVAERGGVPVATTIHGKGAIAESHPLSLGVVGANGARPYANDYLAGADAVLFVGTRANSTDTNGFTSPPRDGLEIMQIDIDTIRAGRNYHGSHALVGDARATLDGLAEVMVEQPERATDLARQVAAWKAAWRASEIEPQREIPVGMLDPRDVVLALQRQLPPEAIILAEPGTPTPNVSAYWETQVAGRTVIDPRGHGPMGYVIPAAIGVAIAAPDRPVVGLTGDGSFAMACGELETIARLALPLLFVQFTNASLGWIKMLQHLYLGERYFSVDPGPINDVAVSQGMGIDAALITTADALETAVGGWVANRRPLFLDVRIPDEIALVPPVAPWQAALAGKLERPVY